MTVKLSIVMGVYNDADKVGRTIDSILQQTYGDFEFIIVDDGSTDGSREVLENYAGQDERIRLVRQHNQGLTQALINGCAQARGSFIARQDAGDFSCQDRMEKQIQYLQCQFDTAAVFCWFRLIDPDGVLVTAHRPSPRTVAVMLDPSDGRIAAPSHHGSALFRREIYLQCGGYRKQFYFAQDLDLWIRMAEHGSMHVIDEYLYDSLIVPDSISGTYHDCQRALHAMIVRSAHNRRCGLDDHQVLADASMMRPEKSRLRQNTINRSHSLYFIGSCLFDKQPDLARAYFKKAIALYPANFKAWYKLLRIRKS